MIRSIHVWYIIFIFQSLIVLQSRAGLFRKNFGLVIDNIDIKPHPDFVKKHSISWEENNIVGYFNVTRAIQNPKLIYTLKTSALALRNAEDEVYICDTNAHFKNKLTQRFMTEFYQHINKHTTCPVKPNLYKFDEVFPDNVIQLPFYYKKIKFNARMELYGSGRSVGYGNIQGRLIKTSYLYRRGCKSGCLA